MSQNQNNLEISMKQSASHTRFLTFIIDNVYYGIELLNIIEIIHYQAITRVPRLPDYVDGIVNLRGKIIPIIDFRAKFQLDATEPTERTCIIVLSLTDIQVGIIVDEVATVINIPNETLAEPLNNNLLDSQKCVKSVAKLEHATILNIDCEKIFN